MSTLSAKEEVRLLYEVLDLAEDLVGVYGDPPPPDPAGKIPVDAQKLLELRSVLRRFRY